jgi:amino acid transporter
MARETERIETVRKMSEAGEKVPEGLAYKDMKASYYYISTLALFVVEATLAILLDDVTTVFDLLAAIAVTCLGFLFPGVFYLVAHKRYSKKSEKGNQKKCANFHVVMGCIVFCLCMFSNIYGYIH